MGSQQGGDFLCGGDTSCAGFSSCGIQNWPKGSLPSTQTHSDFSSLQPPCLSPDLPCSEGKAVPPVVGCMCSALQAEVEHLRSLVLQCLDDQKKLQQETLRLSSQLQRFCSGTEGIQQVRTRHLSSQPCSGLSTLILVLCRLQRRKQLLTDPSIRVEVRCLILG